MRRPCYTRTRSEHEGRRLWSYRESGFRTFANFSGCSSKLRNTKRLRACAVLSERDRIPDRHASHAERTLDEPTAAA